MSAKCYEDFCRDHNIDEITTRIKFFFMAAAFVAAVYGGMVLVNGVSDSLGR